MIWLSLPIGYNEGSAVIEDNSAYAEMYSGDVSEAFSSTASDGDYMTGGEFRESRSVLVDGGDHFGVSAVTVDPKEELVWMGNSGVRK